MAAGFCHPAAVKHNYLVGVSDCGEAVGHHDHCPPFIEARKIFHYHALVLSVKSVRGLVEQNERGILIDGAGDQDSLLLSLAQPNSVGPDFSVIFQWQRVDIFFYIGQNRSFLITVSVSFSLAHCNISFYRL